MKITRVCVYSVTMLPKIGGYSSGSGFVPHIDTSVVVLVDTDAGITGAGETCPIGTHYAPAFSQGAEAGIPIVAEGLIGADPFHIEKINREWDRSFNGSLYLKAPLHTALWDIMGQATGRPVCDLLGGRWPEPVPLYRSVLFGAHTSPEDIVAPMLACRDDGYRHFQLKVGVDVDDDIERVVACAEALQPGELIIAGANTRFSLHEAIRFAQALRGLDSVVIEQPCLTLEECIHFRKHCPLPVKLDEVMTTPQDLIRAYEAGALDVCCIKIARVGGLTKAQRMRDLCCDLGLAVVANDIWGSDITTAALTHFASSTPPATCCRPPTSPTTSPSASPRVARVPGTAASAPPGRRASASYPQWTSWARQSPRSRNGISVLPGCRERSPGTEHYRKQAGQGPLTR